MKDYFDYVALFYIFVKIIPKLTYMKKTLLPLAFIFAIVNVFAQESVVLSGHGTAPDLQIKGENSVDGSISAYLDNVFTINGYDNGDINRINWILELPLKTGGTEIYASAENSITFSVPAISGIDKYLVNEDGCIYGNVIFNGFTDKEVKSSCRASFELKPVFISVELVSLEKTTDYLYDATVSIKYAGSDQLKIEVEEEHSSGVLTSFHQEQYLIHKVENINSHYHTWIDFTIANEYGKSVETIELSPEMFDSSGSIEIQSQIEYDIYTITGIPVSISVKDDYLKSLDSGLYIVQCKSNGSVIRRFKLQKK